ncbi:hypothetical protein [Bradyrhizobium sp. USDA 4506]
MADHKNPNHHPRNDDSLPRMLLDLLRKLTQGMSEEGRVAVCALVSLPAAQYFHVDAQFSFWLTFLALGGYLSLRLIRMVQ